MWPVSDSSQQRIDREIHWWRHNDIMLWESKWEFKSVGQYYWRYLNLANVQNSCFQVETWRWEMCIRHTQWKFGTIDIATDQTSTEWHNHDDVIKWKHFPRYWPFVRGIHRSSHKGQWRGALVFTLICVWINGCVNNREAGDLRRYCAHYGVTVMIHLWMSIGPFLLVSKSQTNLGKL